MSSIKEGRLDNRLQDTVNIFGNEDCEADVSRYDGSSGNVIDNSFDESLNKKTMIYISLFTFTSYLFYTCNIFVYCFTSTELLFCNKVSKGGGYPRVVTTHLILMLISIKWYSTTMWRLGNRYNTPLYIPKSLKSVKALREYDVTKYFLSEICDFREKCVNIQQFTNYNNFKYRFFFLSSSLGNTRNLIIKMTAKDR